MSAQQVLQKIGKYRKQGNHLAAIKLCEDFLGKFPKNRRVRDELHMLSKPTEPAQDPPAQVQSILQAMFHKQAFETVVTQAQTLLGTFPNSNFLWNLLGVAQLRRGDDVAAERAFLKAIQVSPAAPNAYCGLADLRKSQGNPEEAVALYCKALEFAPSDVSVLNNLGTILTDLGQFPEAVAQLSRAATAAPEHATVAYNHANALQKSGDLAAAIDEYRRAAAISPDFVEAHHNLGLALRLMGDLPAAIASFQTVLGLAPDHVAAKAEQLHLMAQIGDWRWMDDVHDLPEDFGCSSGHAGPFPFLVLQDDPVNQRRRSENHALGFGNVAPAVSYSRPQKRAGKLRIGYFSADFHDHATMHLLAKLFEHHDRSRFEIFAYSFGPQTGDTAQRAVQTGVDQFREVSSMGTAAVVAQARADGLDIAVDLKGYTGGNRAAIFMNRVAPVQIAWLGYPGSMGHPCYDYAVADDVVLPPDLYDSFSEQVISLPGSYQINARSQMASEPAPTRTECGLPESGFVFCCFNNNYKITRRELDIWMRLLTKVEGSVLWLLRGNEWVADNLRAEARARGVAPERLVFADRAPAASHMARHQNADLFLDTFNVNAHTTASDALWAGLPVVTKMGRQFAARVCASVLHAAGLPQLVTNTEAEYEALALALAQDAGRLGQIRADLAAAQTTAPLFDAGRSVANLEMAFDMAFDRYCAGLAPGAFRVPGPRA